MKQPYNFEAVRPPVLTEKTLRAEAQRRKLRRQTLILTLAALAIQIILVVLAGVLYRTQPMLALLCLGYVCLSATGGGLAALVCTKERRFAE